LNKALLDTDIYSEVIKAANPLVVGNAITYRRTHGKLTISVISVMEIVRGFQQNQIGMADTMIAAIALHHNLELVTGNTSHFQRVQQLGYPLTLANWRA
jgi:tRNA(fMet)-specific endonuclease VapC